MYHPFPWLTIVGFDAIPVGTAAVQAARSNTQAPACVNEVILKFVISAALTDTEILYLFPAITLIGAYI